MCIRHFCCIFPCFFFYIHCGTISSEFFTLTYRVISFFRLFFLFLDKHALPLEPLLNYHSEINIQLTVILMSTESASYVDCKVQPKLMELTRLHFDQQLLKVLPEIYSCFPNLSTLFRQTMMKIYKH